jgi:2'-5' RNA ligase
VRLFVAVEIGEALAARAGELGRELQTRVAGTSTGAKVTWIPDDRLHLTVRFIGEVDDPRAVAVREALEPPLRIGPFALTLAGAGAFPLRGSPRVLWVGVAAGREELAAAERELSARLAPIGIPEEDRAYSPHLTLARVREPAGLRSERLLEGLTDRELGTVTIGAITLFQSKLSPKGPTYTPLLRIAMGESEEAPLH